MFQFLLKRCIMAKYHVGCNPYLKQERIDSKYIGLELGPNFHFSSDKEQNLFTETRGRLIQPAKPVETLQ